MSRFSKETVKIVVAASVLGLLLLPTTASAVGGPPLKIAKFTMEATRATRLASLGKDAEIENLPYETPFTQAGGHPWALTTVVEFENELIPSEDGRIPTQEPKDVFVNLPPGLLGNPMAVPRCSLTEAFARGECPGATQVGVYRVRWFDGKQTLGPIVDVAPEKGQSAEFALENEFHVSAAITGHLVRAHEHGKNGYGLSVSSTGIPTVQLYRIETTFWGVPADPSHDAMRGLVCKANTLNSSFDCGGGKHGGGESAEVPLVPFLTLGSNCAAGAEEGILRADSWEEPGSIREGHYQGFTEAAVTMPRATGCNLLAFHPTIELRPDTLVADEPVGLDANVNVPLNEAPDATATPQVRNATVTLPEGMSVNPGAVDGIKACEPTGSEGINIEGPESERVSDAGELQLAPGKCPDQSIIGTAEAVTPLLWEPVRGHVFLARPGCGGVGQAACTEEDVLDGNLFKLYLELGGEGELASTGVHLKLNGKTEVNPATGQSTTIFEENPQTPFSELKVHLNGGPRAPLANPAVCGDAVTTAEFMPWSAPGVTPAPESLFVAGTPDATPSSFYRAEGCSGPPPFKPGFVAGTVTPQAGQFSSFTVNLSRGDREQYIKGIQVHTPPGLSGMLASVPLCGEPQADNGECLDASKIGTTRVASGAGSHPFDIGGNVYLTGPYCGPTMATPVSLPAGSNCAPFGLSVVVPLVAGPFNLGKKVVRARIAVDSADSTLTVTTDEAGPHAVPQIVFGVPVRLKRITVNIDRSRFMFNPTNCAGSHITANIAGSEDAVSSVASSFAVGGCKSLGFKPAFTASTSGRTSRTRGASLDAKVSYPKGAMGNDANIASVKVSLPKQLPSRLTTLQKACPAATFAVDPAGCSTESIVGVVRATTPLLPVGLSGPVYFVSHGGERFPNLIIVLQGYGVRVDLVGDTFISKAGITSSTFRTIPDVPVDRFELYLPQGKYSALAANGNLCKNTKTAVVRKATKRIVGGRVIRSKRTVRERKAANLIMPTEFVAQNGLVFKQSTKISVTGCGAGKADSARDRPSRKRSGMSSRHVRWTNTARGGKVRR